MGKTKEAYKSYGIALATTVTQEILDVSAELAEELEELGYTLRVGGELTDDTAINAIKDNAKIEVFLPWEEYNDWDVPVKPMVGAFEMAWKVHPDWQSLTEDDRRIHARTSHIVMGPSLDAPIDLLICFTDPESDTADDIDQAIRIADINLIPVFDLALGIEYTLNQLTEWMEKQ